MKRLLLAIFMAASAGAANELQAQRSESVDERYRQVRDRMAATAAASAANQNMSYSPGNRGRISLVINGLSFHYGKRTYTDENGRTRRYNELNFGLGIQFHANDNFSFNAGFYRNSHHRTSFYLTSSYETSTDSRLGLGIEAGAVTGYDHLLPLVVAFGRAGAQDDLLNLRIGTPPPVMESVPRVIGAQLRVNPLKIIP